MYDCKNMGQETTRGFRIEPGLILVQRMTCWFSSLTCDFSPNFGCLNQCQPPVVLNKLTPKPSVSHSALWINFSAFFMLLMEPVGLDCWELWRINGCMCSDCFIAAVVNDSCLCLTFCKPFHDPAGLGRAREIEDIIGNGNNLLFIRHYASRELKVPYGCYFMHPPDIPLRPGANTLLSWIDRIVNSKEKGDSHSNLQWEKKITLNQAVIWYFWIGSAKALFPAI